ncbi:type 1 glutamine amidotransferase [Candidatus Nanosynbacter featherlites]|uniref:Lipid II isoglutaminyl synthase (glutamine-hydrolyzing) subunit GatD n=1 Tax=Candidatus Nanosynbacter featherlites TaxID=2572088 RepID=A0A4P9A3N3_9BACT|nr:glutamine amidotransferase [Candidatus Nanosynbacter featherlites]QCT42444.1 glutamine amidotransferase [Candidatus Nanosynbacter featherlites]
MTTITIIQLYPKDMNLYGDWGNTLVLKKRLEWRGFNVEIIDHNPGDATDFSTGDIFVGGGGQDAGQLAIQDDLLSRGEELKTLANDGVPMLLICGMYQLFGRQFITNDGSVIRGIGVLPVETTAGEERLIGNITLESERFGTIVGYENHSGQTFLDDTVQPLGKVVRGAGNNTTDGTEGVQFNNVIATYLHGSLLPKNPKIADFLIAKALERRGISAEDLKPLDVDTLAQTAQQVAAERPR